MPVVPAAPRFRGPIALLAAWLVVVQTVLAGIALGHTAALAAAGPIDAAPICHGAGATDAGGTPAPDDGRTWHLCCIYCTSAGFALEPPAIANTHILELPTARHLPPSSAILVVRTSRAIRAGPSQAPPHRA